MESKQVVMEAGDNTSKSEPNGESMVYSREEYAKKEFWDDRFKESKGFFDWYANWKEIKPDFETLLQGVIGVHESPSELMAAHSHLTILQVGCGNSKMSQEMAVGDGYWHIYNTDISGVVLDKMKKHHESLPGKMAEKAKKGEENGPKTA